MQVGVFRWDYRSKTQSKQDLGTAGTATYRMRFPGSPVCDWPGCHRHRLSHNADPVPHRALQCTTAMAGNLWLFHRHGHLPYCTVVHRLGHQDVWQPGTAIRQPPPTGGPAGAGVAGGDARTLPPGAGRHGRWGCEGWGECLVMVGGGGRGSADLSVLLGVSVGV